MPIWQRVRSVRPWLGAKPDRVLSRHRAKDYTRVRLRSEVGNKREEFMKHLFTTALVTATFALPLAAAAQERYPALNPDQLSPEQKAYVESLQKLPRNNT